MLPLSLMPLTQRSRGKERVMVRDLDGISRERRHTRQDSRETLANDKINAMQLRRMPYLALASVVLILAPAFSSALPRSAAGTEASGAGLVAKAVTRVRSVRADVPARVGASGAGEAAGLTLRGGEATRVPSMQQLVVIGTISGAFAGLVTDMAMFPIEKLKIRLQAGGLSGIVGTPLEALRDLFANVWMVLYTSPVYYGLYFGVYEPLKAFLIARNPDAENEGAVLASIGATWSMFLARVPAEVIKTRVMSNADASPLAAMLRLYNKAGLMGFYTGYFSLAFVEYPFNILEIGLYA